MKKICVFVGLCAFLAGCPALGIAKERLPAAVEKMLREVYPGSSSFKWEAGLINADAVDDVAVLVTIPNNAASEPRLALAVFYGDGGGGYRLVDGSRQWNSKGRIDYNLAIGKASVFLNYECAALCGNEAANGGFQFKDHDGRLLLIGEEEQFFTNPTQNGDSTGHSINYLTRKAVFWRTIGKKRREFKTQFPQFAPIALGAFDTWESNDSRPKEARGYVDEEFKFVSY
jgi:hypothetical protein